MRAFVSSQPWPAEQEAALRKGWCEGLSAAQIARELHRQCGVTRSRNAVIGKVHRLDLAGRGRVVPVNPNKVKGARQKAQINRIPPSVTKPLKRETLAVDLAIIRALPALGGETGCRFIPRDPAIDPRRCGRATGVGGVWCAQHARLVYVPTRAKPKVRKAEDPRARLLRDMLRAA